jgi:hypothetical protein
MRLLLLLLFSFLVSGLKGQPDFGNSQLFNDRVFNDKIKTVVMYKEGWNLSYPIIRLRSNDKIIFGFDLLGENAENYYYTFIHCDKDWKKSDIFPNDYLDGYPENMIEDFKRSFNTTTSYYHYSLSFPNDRVKFNNSGNYILYIYPVDKPNEPVLTKRFIITEEAVTININVHRPLMTKENDSHQQVDFTVNYAGMTFTDPYRNVFATVLQNGRWSNAKTNLKPDFFGTNELKYNSLSDKNIFRGGNEYRYFDIKSIRYQSEYVMKIDYAVPNYNVFLFPSENREFKAYFYWQDFNGKFYVAFQEGRNPDTDADYVNVFFTLPSKQAIQNGKMYVSGALNNWEFNKNNEMSYNSEKGQYECSMQVKQGWYNYEYVLFSKEDMSGVPTRFEGSHFETENDYIVLIYFRNSRDRYDRVVGSKIANTLNKMTN